MKKYRIKHGVGFQQNHENKIYRYRKNRSRRLLRFRKSTKTFFLIKNKCGNRKVISSYNSIRYSLPENCLFYPNPENFSNILNEILDKLRPFDTPQILRLDLSKVNEIDHYAVLILLTMVNYLNIKKVSVTGNIPLNVKALNILEESDFFSWVKTGHKFKKKGKDLIYTIGKDSADQDSYADRIYEIMEHLTGSPQRYQPLYNVLGEIQINSIEHSNKNDDAPNWFMSVHYETNKCLITMADIGKGIVNTLNLLFSQKTLKFIKGSGHGDVLLKLFKGDYQSSTREPNRNNGLPDIYSSIKDNKITNLNVISNKGWLVLPEGKTFNLGINFPGTFYCIEISKDTVEKWIPRTSYVRK